MVRRVFDAMMDFGLAAIAVLGLAGLGARKRTLNDCVWLRR